MRQDVRKCFVVGALCLWLFWDAVGMKMPTVGIEEEILKEQEVETYREDFDWGDLKIYLNNAGIWISLLYGLQRGVFCFWLSACLKERNSFVKTCQKVEISFWKYSLEYNIFFLDIPTWLVIQ